MYKFSKIYTATSAKKHRNTLNPKTPQTSWKMKTTNWYSCATYPIKRSNPSDKQNNKSLN